MHKNTLQKTISVITLSVLSMASVAQEAEVISVGSIDFIPTLNLQASYDDNIRRVSESEGPESDTIITVTPAIRAQIDNGISGFSLDYSITRGEYLSESNESFLNQNYGASFGWNVVGTHVVTLSANVLDAHDARTPDAPSGLGRDDLDEYEDTTWTLDYRYGERQILFGYALTASLFDKRYKTNREVTPGSGFESTALNDRDVSNYSAQLNINVSEALQFNVNYGQSDIEYDQAASSDRDSEEQSYGVGVVWDFSESFDFSASVAKVDKEFADDTREDATVDRISLAGTWSPYSYSSVSLNLSQSADESNDADEDFIESFSSEISWRHGWTDLLVTNISYAKTEDDYIGGTIDRLDDSTTVGLTASYQFRRWIALSLGLESSSEGGKNSESPESDKTTATLGAAFTL